MLLRQGVTATRDGNDLTPEHKTEMAWTLALAGVLVVITVLIIITGMSDLKEITM